MGEWCVGRHRRWHLEERRVPGPGDELRDITRQAALRPTTPLYAGSPGGRLGDFVEVEPGHAMDGSGVRAERFLEERPKVVHRDDEVRPGAGGRQLGDEVPPKTVRNSDPLEGLIEPLAEQLRRPIAHVPPRSAPAFSRSRSSVRYLVRTPFFWKYQPAATATDRAARLLGQSTAR